MHRAPPKNTHCCSPMLVESRDDSLGAADCVSLQRGLNPRPSYSVSQPPGSHPVTSRGGRGRGAACVVSQDRPELSAGSELNWNRGASPTKNANTLKPQPKSLGPGAARRVSTDFCRSPPRLRLLPGQPRRHLRWGGPCVPASDPVAGFPGLGHALFSLVSFQMGSKLKCATCRSLLTDG